MAPSETGRTLRLNCGLVRERGTLLTSTTSLTSAASMSAANSSIGRVECPMVKNGLGIWVNPIDSPRGAGGLRLQVLDLDEGEIERVRVHHIVLDARAARVGDVQFQRGLARSAAGLLEQEFAVGERNDDIIGLVTAPSRLGAGSEPPFGDPHVRLGHVDMGRGFLALGQWGQPITSADRGTGRGRAPDCWSPEASVRRLRAV